MATVYRAWDTILDVPRAIKLLEAAPETRRAWRARLRAEARAMARLSRHPNVLRIYDIGEEAGQDFVVMELAEGGSLADRIAREGPLAPREALQICVQILSALAAAHAEGIVHRDVKPHNILLAEGGRALLADFGIALMAESALRTTRTGMAIGSMAFMAPEQRLDARRVGPTADLYAVGTTLYNLITADNPIDLFTAAEGSERWLGIPAAIRAILMRATRHEPGERYGSAREMAEEVAQALLQAGGTPIVVEDPLDPGSFPAPSLSLGGGLHMRATDALLPAPDARPPADPATRTALEILRDPDTLVPPGGGEVTGVAEEIWLALSRIEEAEDSIELEEGAERLAASVAPTLFLDPAQIGAASVPAEPPRRRSSATVAIALGVVVALLLLGWRMTRPDPVEPTPLPAPAMVEIQPEPAAEVVEPPAAAPVAAPEPLLAAIDPPRSAALRTSPPSTQAPASTPPQGSSAAIAGRWSCLLPGGESKELVLGGTDAVLTGKYSWTRPGAGLDQEPITLALTGSWDPLEGLAKVELSKGDRHESARLRLGRDGSLSLEARTGGCDFVRVSG